MSVADPGDIFDGGGGGGSPFVTKEQKEEWYRNKTKLGIVGATGRRTNQFGTEEVRFEVVTGGERYTLTLSATPMREEQVIAVNELIAAGHKAVGPVRLTKVETKGGTPAWALTGKAEADGEVPAAPVAAAAAPAASTAADDDSIPF